MAVPIDVGALAPQPAISLLTSLLIMLFFLLCCLYLPIILVKIRMWMFTSLNDGRGIQFPNTKVSGKQLRTLYANKHASLRNNCGLSDFFWYHLFPGPQIHQEQVENGPLYDDIANLTKLFITLPQSAIAELAARHWAYHVAHTPRKDWSIVSLRSYLFPLFARMYHELVFGEMPDEKDVPLLIGSGQDTLMALKCLKLRNLPLRSRLTEYILQKLKDGKCRKQMAGTSLTTLEQAWYIQGVFFHTGCVQMSEGLCHTLIALGQHPHVWDTLATSKDKKYLDNVITESLRCFPLFGIAHRILDDDVILEDGCTTLAKGSVLCFNYPVYHSQGYERPGEFLPERWDALKKSDSNYMPFGVIGNRPCPGQQIALVWMKELVPLFIEEWHVHSPLVHTRSMPDGGLCVLAPARHPLGSTTKSLLMTALKVYEKLFIFAISIVQLVCGAIMIVHAKRLRLATRLYDNQEVNYVPPHTKSE